MNINFEPITVGKGRYGGAIIHQSPSKPNKIQVTFFGNDGRPNGHEEYNTLEEAIVEHMDKIDHPVFNLKANNKTWLLAWQEATFENDIDTKKYKYSYVSPLRPLNGVMVDGIKLTNKSGKMGVLYREKPLPFTKQESLQMFPVSKDAKLETAKEYIKSGNRKLANETTVKGVFMNSAETNKNKLAKSLLRIARLLLAIDYPEGIDEKGKKSIDMLNQALEEKHIWNVDYKDLNKGLSKAFEIAQKKLWDSIRVKNPVAGSAFYFIGDGTVGVFSINKKIKEIDKFLKAPDEHEFAKYLEQRKQQTANIPQDAKPSDAISEMREVKEFYESWLPVLNAKKEVKKYIEKGRKPNLNAPKKEIYTPPPSTLKDIAKVKELLEKIVEDSREKMEKNLVDDWKIKIESYLEDKPEATRNKIIKIFGQLVRAVNISDGVWKIDENILENVAKETVDAVKEKFIEKNIKKLKSIIGEKNVEIKSAKNSSHVNRNTLSGVINFEFEDGTGFDVWNDVVTVWNNRTIFNKFPTTFHNVKFKDGTVKKIVSEKDMNEVWAKE